ncbi:DNA polymerase III subunit beta [Acidicapsa ligni]|uniref:DNA polymerase III subunit beta n=1 Tax=Acidicapsa ligni TaxID=542300 RepID=UPI0021E0B54E|nr:DNA polymerase III subunit beta [Acidicapsa ligni]
MAAATIPVPTETKSPAPVLMELAVDRGQFLAEVQAATRVTEGKSTIPILTHLLLRTTNNGALSVTGSDLQRTITTECPAAVKSQGAAAVPAQKLLTYLKLLPNGQVNLKLLGNDRLQITAANSRTKIPGMKPESYPAIPVASGVLIRLSARALRTVIRQSLFAVATSQDKYLLNAGLLLLRSDRMGMVATDGRRLSMVEVHDEALAGEELRKVLLPRECMSDLLALFSWSKEETIEFREDETCLYFQLGPRKLSVRKLTDQFPNYEAILPRDNTNSVVLASSDLLASVQRVLQFADERSNAVKLHLADNLLTLSASMANHGESQDSLPLSYNSTPVTIGFNGAFLIEFIKTIGAEGELRLSLKDSASAAVITPEAFNPEYQQRYVVMPMRV